MQVASHEIRQHASPLVATLARLGFAAKGMLYVVVGGLAATSAFGSGGRTTGTRGALQTLLEQPFGKALLAIVALGLAGYAIFQFVRAVWDPEHEGTDAKGMGKRVGYFFSACLHASLFTAAIRLLFHTSGGRRDGSGDANAQSWSAELMAHAWGRWAVAAIGIGIVVYGVYQLIRAWRAKLDDQLVLEGIGARAAVLVRRVCRFGMASRGVVFSLVGGFFIVAAWHYNPAEAKGLGGALRSLAQQPFGPYLLGVVALGLIAYGVYQFLLARYRRIRT